jgi:protease I
MNKTLQGMTVAILIAEGFEESEFLEPKKALESAGAQTVVVSPSKGKIKGWKDKNWGDAVTVDQDLNQADAKAFDALLLPGGVMNPDKLRMDEKAVNFVKSFVKAHKPVAAICHGPWILINAEAVKGKNLTSYASIKIDLVNAGAHWVDQEVVQDGTLVTSRKPEDIPAFNRAFIALLSEARQYQ